MSFYEAQDTQDAYMARPFQEHPVAKFVDTEHFLKLFFWVFAIGDSVSWNDVPVFYPIPWSNRLDYLLLE